MLDEFCKLFGHLGFSSGALPSSTLLKGIIESLQKVVLQLCLGIALPAISSIETTLHHLILATLRHPQLTTRLTLQLRQNVFLRVPINVVGTGTCPFPTPRSRVRSRSPKHADAKGGSPRPSPKKAARTEATSTPAREVTPPPPPAPCRLGAGPCTVYVCYTHARWYVGSKPPRSGLFKMSFRSFVSWMRGSACSLSPGLGFDCPNLNYNLLGTPDHRIGAPWKMPELTRRD
ncbi:hypothetical protein PAPYR_12691 [Paratrimastix pyriformis]|uniref:Uncharacterized protein n=1 Tax=Paratrimastix pyriformis TaxID=342808 RepID=A0ABQ8U1G4_9EUKA|nr:hypothetical protein PAPYR_12691 [Paratrimastix pyriformis]